MDSAFAGMTSSTMEPRVRVRDSCSSHITRAYAP
jgi:hypothetical protein